MTVSLISFGPDLEPLESEARREARFAGPRRDAIVVSGTSEEVVTRLVEAQGSAGGWCELEQVLRSDERRRIYVNSGTIRFVVDHDQPLP